MKSNYVMPQGTAMKKKEQRTNTRESKAPRTDTVYTAQGGRSRKASLSNSLEKKSSISFSASRHTRTYKFI